MSLASRLAKGFFRLAALDGTAQPMIDGVSVRAVGSVAHQFSIALVRRARIGDYGAVIDRQTVRTKFWPRLAESDRLGSRLSWSSAATTGEAQAR